MVTRSTSGTVGVWKPSFTSVMGRTTPCSAGPVLGAGCSGAWFGPSSSLTSVPASQSRICEVTSPAIGLPLASNRALPGSVEQVVGLGEHRGDGQPLAGLGRDLELEGLSRPDVAGTEGSKFQTRRFDPTKSQA